MSLGSNNLVSGVKARSLELAGKALRVSRFRAHPVGCDVKPERRIIRVASKAGTEACPGFEDNDFERPVSPECEQAGNCGSGEQPPMMACGAGGMHGVRCLCEDTVTLSIPISFRVSGSFDAPVEAFISHNFYSIDVYANG